MKNKQKWTPKDTHHNVSTFINLVQNGLNKEKTKKMKNPKSSLSKGKQKAMEELAKTKDIVITNADKGGTLVIMNVEKNINEDKRNYNTLQEDTTLQHSNLVNNAIDKFKKENLLCKKLDDGLKSVNPKPPKFYIAPKIHKENNPGRAVINSINCHTSEISRFVDHHLQPLVREIPAYIKNDIDI